MQPAVSAVAANPIPDPETSCTLALHLDLSNPETMRTGLFADNTAAYPSKVWQITVKNQPLQVADHELTVASNGNNTIQVQVTFNMSGWSFVDDPELPGPSLDVNGTTLQASALRVSVQFARNRKKEGSTSIFASPFPLGAGTVRTIVDGNLAKASIARNPLPPAVIGIPTRNSGSGSGKKDCYIFIVSVTCCVRKGPDGTPVVFTASHDPEMEVGM